MTHASLPARLLLPLVLAGVVLVAVQPAAANPINSCTINGPLLVLCLEGTSPLFVVAPSTVDPGPEEGIGEIQEWKTDVGTGSVSVGCFRPYRVEAIVSCADLASLGFTLVGTVLVVSARTVVTDPIGCNVEVWNASLTLKTLGTGIEDFPAATLGLGGLACNVADGVS